MSRSLFAILASAVTVGGLTVVVWLARLVLRMFPERARRLGLACLGLYGAALVVRPAMWPIIDLAVIAGAVGGVLLIERGLGTRAAVAAFLCVAAVVDLVSMSGGLSRMIVERYREGTSDLLLQLTLVMPIRGRIIPIVGIGDLLVAGAAAAALLRLGLRPAVVMGTLAVGLLSALAYGLWRGGAPAVPFVAAAVLVLVWARS